MSAPPVAPGPPDPRHFALQLAAVADRLDARSARAVERMESACLALERAATSASGARMRVLGIASAGLFLGALIAIGGSVFALSTARQQLASIHRDHALLAAVNAADIALCGERLCARLEPGGKAAGEGGEYRQIAAR